MAVQVEAPGTPLTDSFLPAQDTIPPLPADRVKLVLVTFRSGEAVHQHPELAAYLEQGAQITSAAPRITEAGLAKLLVVLTFPADA